MWGGKQNSTTFEISVYNGEEENDGKKFCGWKVSPQSQLQGEAGGISGPYLEDKALGRVAASGGEGRTLRRVRPTVLSVVW